MYFALCLVLAMQPASTAVGRVTGRAINLYHSGLCNHNRDMRYRVLWSLISLLGRPTGRTRNGPEAQECAKIPKLHLKQ